MNVSHLDSILAIVPVLDEEATIARVIQTLRSVGLRHIRVVDNGSRDRSREIASQAGAEVLHEPISGYGRACWRGLQDMPDAIEWILFCDGDGSDDLNAVHQFFALRDRFDLILGNRTATATGRAAMTPVQRFGNRLATTSIQLGWSYRYQDLGPLRSIRRSALAQIQMQDRGFGWTLEMQVRAIECGLRICELPVNYQCRQGGRSKISGTIGGSIRAGTVILSPVAIASETPFSDEEYGAILQAYVNGEGRVNYVALQANSKPLKDFVAKLGAVSPVTYDAWSEPEKIAFLINAYNAITLESIVDRHPLDKSIKDIRGVWNVNQHVVVGRSITLDTIEHEMLRKDFQEPRIHAALVCAAISCPPLQQEPYTGEKLEAQLDDRVRKWLSNPQGLQIDRTQNRVSISAIFDWFGEDWQQQYAIENKFVGSAKDRAVLNFISNYTSPEDKEYLEQGQYKLNHLDYDWSLNRQ